MEGIGGSGVHTPVAEFLVFQVGLPFGATFHFHVDLESGVGAMEAWLRSSC